MSLNKNLEKIFFEKKFQFYAHAILFPYIRTIFMSLKELSKKISYSIFYKIFFPSLRRKTNTGNMPVHHIRRRKLSPKFVLK